MSIAVIGDALIDINLPIHGIRPGETYHRDILVSCGGTANVAVHVSRLGEEARFMGKVGSDALGLFFRENLRNNGVDDLTFIDNKHPTGLCIALVYKNGERSMVASRGASDYLTRQEADTHLGQIMKSKFAYFSGYSLLGNSDTVLYLMEKCCRRTEVWFNPGAPNIIRDSVKEIVYKYVDGVILNMDEARSITSKTETDEIVAELARIVSLSVITRGEAACIVAEGEEWNEVPVSSLVEDADTTGAGDAFSAGFLVGRLRGLDKLESARLGHEVAGSFLKGKMRML